MESLQLDSHAGFALELDSLRQLRQQAASDPEAAVAGAAREFEALFLNLMLKSMREAIPRAGLLDSNERRFHESLLDQQLSQHLAGRGLGLAEALTRQLLSDLSRETMATSTSVDQTAADKPSMDME